MQKAAKNISNRAIMAVVAPRVPNGYTLEPAWIWRHCARHERQRPKVLDGEPDRYRHKRAGPQRYGFDQMDAAPRDQWPHHAVATIIRANSLLRSLPEVDSSKVGGTGISWGGYLTCLADVVDPRFKFAIPVDGCGFLDERLTWAGYISDFGHDRWMKPGTFLRACLELNARCSGSTARMTNIIICRCCRRRIACH